METAKYEFPEPLFEAYITKKDLCLICVKNYAKMVLRTTSKDLVPLCDSCSKDWNIYGYRILKRIKLPYFILRVIIFKILHPFKRPYLVNIFANLRNLQTWAIKMRKWM